MPKIPLNSSTQVRAIFKVARILIVAHTYIPVVVLPILLIAAGILKTSLIHV